MNKKFLLILIATFILLSSIFCFYIFYPQDNINDNSKASTINIGVVPFPGYSGFYIARDKEFFKKKGLDVNIKSYNTISDQITGYNNGEIQMAAFNVADAVSILFDGVDSKIVAIIDYSTGVDAIISDLSIKTIDQIKGKRVAYEKGTLEEFLIASVLRKYTLSLDDVISIDANPEEAAKMLVTGETDVAVTYEPYLSDALKDPKIHLIYSTSEDPSMISDVLVVTTKLVDSKPEIIKNILVAYFEAQNYLETNPSDSYPIIAKELGIDEGQVENQLKGVSIRTLEQNKKAFEPGESEASFYLKLDAVGKFLARIKNILNIINTDILVDPYFIRSLK